MNCITKILKSLLYPSIVPLILLLIFLFWLPHEKLLCLFLNIEGTFLLASVVSPTEGAWNNWKGRIKWVICDSQNYASGMRFNFFNLYVGIFCFVVSQVVSNLR
jgi:Na+/H+-translocating membrane pyrophosphatase